LFFSRKCFAGTWDRLIPLAGVLLLKVLD